MTRAVFCFGADGSVEISGHAGYAESGKDIVCASISSLCNAMIAVFRVLEAHGHCRDVCCGAEEGRFCLSFRQGDAEARQILCSYDQLFRALEREFPAYLRVL